MTNAEDRREQQHRPLHDMGREEKRQERRERKPIVSVNGRDLTDYEIRAKGLHRVGRRQKAA